MEIRIFSQSPSCPEPVLRVPVAVWEASGQDSLLQGQNPLRKGELYLVFTYVGFCRVLEYPYKFDCPHFHILQYLGLPEILLHAYLYLSCGLTLKINTSISTLASTYRSTPDLTFVLTFDLAEISGFWLPSIPRVLLSLLLKHVLVSDKSFQCVSACLRCFESSTLVRGGSMSCPIMQSSVTGDPVVYYQSSKPTFLVSSIACCL